MSNSITRTAGNGNAINAVFTDKTDNAEMKPQDFLNLFVKQMQNQDFTNPLDSSEMMNQITQLSNMQMMQQMANYSKSNYALSLVGKNVTATRYTVSGNQETVTGVVQKVAIVDNEYVFYVDGKKFSLDKISGIHTGDVADGAVDASSYKISMIDTSETSVSLKWSVPTEDEAAAKNLKYTVYYSQTGPFDTVSKVEAGNVFGTAGQQNLTSEVISGLKPKTSYYVNVVVEDGNGNKSVYKPTIVMTK
ncbi:MAG: hypothetical protein GXY01_08965 [Clostridiales bacterium]|nr:hypothetical protein [Clostridiales bacterium]